MKKLFYGLLIGLASCNLQSDVEVMTIGTDEAFVDVDYAEVIFTDGEPNPFDNTIETCMAEVAALDGTIEDGKMAAVTWVGIYDPEDTETHTEPYLGMCAYSI